MLAPFLSLEFYTDGSLVHFSTCSIMEYGWIFSTDPLLDIKYTGSAIYWASSIKAEILAILTSLIVCPPNSRVANFTDSACAIATFNHLFNIKLTLRHLQNINNVLLWQAIKYVITCLHLDVTLHKVKVHSGNLYNDMYGRYPR